MPLTGLFHRETFSYGLWHITESESSLLEELKRTVPTNIHHPIKRLEWLSGRILASKMLAQKGLPFHGIRYDAYGKPHLIDHDIQISLSHSYPYVVVQISSKHVGIDLEQPKPKLHTIAKRFLSVSELEDAQDDLIKLCVLWCAKEAIYKYHGIGGLHFSTDILIAPFTLSSKGFLKGSMSQPKEKIDLGYEVHDQFVLVYTLPISSAIP